MKRSSKINVLNVSRINRNPFQIISFYSLSVINPKRKHQRTSIVTFIIIIIISFIFFLFLMNRKTKERSECGFFFKWLLWCLSNRIRRETKKEPRARDASDLDGSSTLSLVISVDLDIWIHIISFFLQLFSHLGILSTTWGSTKPEMIYLTQWVTNNIELPCSGFPETCCR